MATKEQIRERAARALGILGQGDTLDSERTFEMDQSYIEVHGQLTVKSIVTWDFDEDIPDEYTPYIVALVAKGRMNTYPLSEARTIRVLGAAKDAQLQIMELNTSDVYSVFATAPDYF